MLLIRDGTFRGLALDWITGNLYVGTGSGNIIVCKPATAAVEQLDCVNILSGQEFMHGIALNPNDGYDCLFLINSRR